MSSATRSAIIIGSLTLLAGAAMVLGLVMQTGARLPSQPVKNFTGEVTRDGNLACLPLAGGKRSGLACAIGLRVGNDYYELANLSQSDAMTSPATEVRVTGQAGPAAETKYKTAGRITVTRFEQL